VPLNLISQQAHASWGKKNKRQALGAASEGQVKMLTTGLLSPDIVYIELVVDVHGNFSS